MKTNDTERFSSLIHNFCLTELPIDKMKVRSHMMILLLGCMGLSAFAQMKMLPFHGGFYQPPHGVCLASSQRTQIQEHLQRNIAELKTQGIIQEMDTRNNVMLTWPLAANESYEHYDYHGVSNFVDHDNDFPAQVVDYNCGERSYDTQEGYNHPGTDFFLWPFAWNLMEANQIRVVAAAPGIIIEKMDGEADKNCDLSMEATWNAIFIRHEDGSQAWYGHLKKNSLTSKTIGDAVQTGEFLGFVGSSGISSGPHLHLEVYDNVGNLIDPFEGECSEDTGTQWLEQRPYYDSGLNRISTHDKPLTFSECPDIDIVHAQNEFCPEDTVFFAVFLRDQLAGQLLRHRVYSPDSSLLATWPNVLQGVAHYSASYWYFPVILPSDAMEGDWWYEVEYLEQYYTHSFAVCRPLDDKKVSANFPTHGIAPNPIQDDFKTTIDIYITGTFIFEIRDITGRLLQSRKLELLVGQHELDFNISNCPQGVYLLTVSDKQERTLGQKLIKS